MQFQKIEIPSGWKEEFSAYPHGLSIWEALSTTITTVNEGIDEVNQKVDAGLIAIEEASITISGYVQTSFDIFKAELQSDFGDLETDLLASINTALADVYTKSQVYTKAEVDAQLNEIENDKAEKTDVGLLSGLLTTAKTSIVAAINELFNSKANKTQEAWITPTLLNGATGTIRYRKNQFGRLEFGGKVTGTNGLPCLQTVSGYRPIGSNVFLSAVKTDVTATRFIILTTAGELYLGAPNGTYEVDMNGISINI